jgi:molybdate transport system ATP-binding protein
LDVAFALAPGITALSGPSGVGKSTTLALIAGLRRPSRGRIVLGTEVLTDVDARIDVPPHRRGIALVFQSLALFPHLSALDNVAFGLPRPLRGRARHAEAARWLERMQAGHLAARRPLTYSGGEAQRVALARAFASRPRVLLLDEPFSALDPTLRGELAALVRALVDELALPALLVTHDRDDAVHLADRRLTLVDGQLVR